MARYTVQLTTNFTREAFACKDGCGFDEVDPALVRGLQDLRNVLGKPIRVLSGCRCLNHNIAVGGSKGSQHLHGRAADIAVKGMTAREIYVKAKLIPHFRGFGRDDERGFLHVDTRQIPARWCYRNGKEVPWYDA